MRAPGPIALLLLVACSDPSSSGRDAPEPRPQPAAERGTGDRAVAESLLAIQAGRCASCHDVDGAMRDALVVPAKPLRAIARTVDPARGTASLASHFAGKDAGDISSWLASLAVPRELPQPTDISGGLIERGERLVAQFGCRACHDEAELDRSAVGNHQRLTAWLRQPDVAHVPLDEGEAAAVAAWLLRAQRQVGATAQGFAFECYELAIENGDWPGVAGRKPRAKGVVDRIDTSVATRKTNYALVFTATVEVPTSGRWTFATASDDGSWLWIDGSLVVDNAGLKPTTRRQGTVALDAGPHELRVAYTQAGGGANLKVLWQPPDGDEAEIPPDRATSSVVRLVPPPRPAVELDPAAIERGRVAARAARCDRCHAVAEEAFRALAAPVPAKALARLTGSTCRLVDAGALPTAVIALPATLGAAERLALAMQADGCLACHVRDGVGGLSPDVREQLIEIEDLGDEGVLPPDLTLVGRRLRPEWLARVVRDGHKARDYVRMRMPAFGAERAEQYQAWFAAVDAAGIVDEEPEFTAEAAELGRQLVGSGGRNCISCHRVAGRASLGPQGMDLAEQFERLRPGWFHDWLLRPTSLRPNTRMPTLWATGGERDEQEVAAVRVWSSLGASAPLPPGVGRDTGALRLDPIDRPILHGAFLKGVSARTLSVGTPERVHYAFDLTAPRLAWIWRGAFLDATGTWHGRAGKLLEPLGQDWQVVDDFAVGDGGRRRLLGQRRTPDGYPVLLVQCGDARYEDRLRPRLARGGAELVRTIDCIAGRLVMTFPQKTGYRTLVGGQPAGRRELMAGQRLEVVYQW